MEEQKIINKEILEAKKNLQKFKKQFKKETDDIYREYLVWCIKKKIRHISEKQARKLL